MSGSNGSGDEIARRLPSIIDLAVDRVSLHAFVDIALQAIPRGSSKPPPVRSRRATTPDR